jgi:AcrR family transcriptional regulator
VPVGRPRRHDRQTGLDLVEAAERIVEREGLEALTVRRVAEVGDTSTRAVYAVFGSKEGLVIALGRRAFELLLDGITAFPVTDDPAADLVDAGVDVWRRFVLQHPALFLIGIQRAVPDVVLAGESRSTASQAWAGLERRFERLLESGGLGGRSAHDAAVAFHALCEGLATIELRGMLRAGSEERVWRDALSALVDGLSYAKPRSSSTSRS